MAVYAVASDVLRDTVRVTASFFSEELAAPVDALARWPLALYWLTFAALIGAAFYFATLDIRHIRVQYASGKRAILKRTLNDKEFRKTLNDLSLPPDERDPPHNGDRSIR